MGVHQREGVIGAIGALERLIPCVYGLYGVFRMNWWHCQCEREERLSGAFFMGIMMDSVRDEALNSVFNALLWGGCLLPLFYA